MVKAEAEVSAGNVIWDCSIMVAILVGRGRSVGVGIVEYGLWSDNDMLWMITLALFEAGIAHWAVSWRQPMSHHSAIYSKIGPGDLMSLASNQPGESLTTVCPSFLRLESMDTC